MTSAARAAAGIALLALLVRAAPARAADDPCAGAALLAALLDVNISAHALPLLDGRESPKLRAHVVNRVASAVSEAREQIAAGAQLPPMGVPRLNAGFREATTFFTMHQPGGRALEDLKFVSAWVRAQRGSE